MRNTITLSRAHTQRLGVPIAAIVRTGAVLVGLAVLPACASDIAPGNDGGDEADDGGAGNVRQDPNMTHTDQGDYTETQVDATDEEAWVYLDLDTGEQVTPANPDGDETWDLRFRRFNVALNGGVSGPGSIEAVFVDDVDLEALDEIPASGWITDMPDGDDEDAEPDLALGLWYDYDVETHVLTPHPGVYVIRTSEGEFGLEMLDYYNGAGTSGYPTFAWKELDL